MWLRGERGGAVRGGGGGEGRRKSQGRTLPPVVARAPLVSLEYLSLSPDRARAQPIPHELDLPMRARNTLNS